MGLLQCDGLDERVVSIAGDYGELYASLLARDGLEFVTYRADLARLPLSPAECDAWLIGGSRRSVYEDDDWIRGLRRFTGRILAGERPLVGVCFGHQMIGLEMGAPVEDVGYTVGAVEYTLHQVPPGECDAADEVFTIAAIHRDQVLELPAGATLLASADGTPIGGFTYCSRILTIQPHPEFSPEVAGTIYDRRAGRIGRDSAARAVASLDVPLDVERVAGWIVTALRS